MSCDGGEEPKTLEPTLKAIRQQKATRATHPPSTHHDSIIGYKHALTLILNLHQFIWFNQSKEHELPPVR